MSDVPTIGGLLHQYRERWVIYGTANGYTVQRRGRHGGGAGQVHRAKDITELAELLERLDSGG